MDASDVVSNVNIKHGNYDIVFPRIWYLVYEVCNRDVWCVELNDVVEVVGYPVVGYGDILVIPNFEENVFLQKKQLGWLNISNYN